MRYDEEGSKKTDVHARYDHRNERRNGDKGGREDVAEKDREAEITVGRGARKAGATVAHVWKRMKQKADAAVEV